MSYHLHFNETVRDGVRRIAYDQIDRALDEAAERGGAEASHAVRKRCKKLRGLIRLVRPAFDGYGNTNKALRDAARRLSDVRDRQAMIETYDLLMDRYGNEVDRRAMGQVRRRLTADLKAATATDSDSAADAPERWQRFVDDLHAVRDQAERWELDDDGFDAVAGGLTKTLGRARKAMAKARKKPTPERLHEWRKRVKYHWYHLRLLKAVYPLGFDGPRKAMKRLSDLLGDAHDLHNFEATLRRDLDAFPDATTVEALLALAAAMRQEREAEAFALGQKALAEKPEHLVKRLAPAWQAWRASALAETV